MLKRMKLHMEAGELRVEKIETHVAFEDSIQLDNEQYILRGVVEHHGDTAFAGHYTSYVRSKREVWYYCNDAAPPLAASFNEVSAAQAYVMNYERGAGSTDSAASPLS